MKELMLATPMAFVITILAAMAFAGASALLSAMRKKKHGQAEGPAGTARQAPPKRPYDWAVDGM